MRLTIEIPPSYRVERNYILSIILSEIFELDYYVNIRHEITETRVSSPDGGCILIADYLFATPQKHWLAPASLPRYPLSFWKIAQTDYQFKTLGLGVPVIYGKHPEDPDFFRRREDTIKLGLDIFGSCFYMLTRYEEVVQNDIDEHGRFPAVKSIAHMNNFLHRPIVNEYMEILWGCLKILWPNIERKKKEFRISPTHDVDLPFKYKNHNPLEILLLIGGDVLKRKNLNTAMTNLSQWSTIKTERKPDPFDSFDWIMDQSDKAGHRSTFNFGGGSYHPNDPHYNLTAKPIQNLISKITQRGHQIGFHPGYRTATDKQAWECEYNKFKSKIPDKHVNGGRQHMLRFQNPETWRIWEENGLQYDSTLMFADHAGFRCGICYEYPVFDLKRKQKLKLRERPLIIMDATVIDERYMGLGQTAEAFDFMNQLRANCKFFGGNFVILWHNDRFTSEKEKEIYKSLIN